MDSRATVQALMDSVQKGDFDKAKSLLSADFQFSGAVPEPIGGEAWIGLSKSMKQAFPNLDYHFQVKGMNGDTANITSELKGTHSGALDLTGIKMGVIPATNKSFTASETTGSLTVKGDQVTSMTMQPTAGSGLMAILGQLGVKPPAM